MKSKAEKWLFVLFIIGLHLVVIPAKAGIHVKNKWMPDYNLGHDE